ncbi:MAG: hypothetical protein COB35_03840 [Gammaproteobacteria bacterium]|nr:MAG: hypothetical protein COB35_03840 [Gammaproteobacteria bacterium]
MDLGHSVGAEIVFVATLTITFFAAYLGRKHSKVNNRGLANEKLNKWLIGLSAGATANSGFIVTGAVGLGYSFGPQWLFLPIAWFLGDLIFWRYCPDRINKVGKVTGVTTLSELLKSGLSGKFATASSILATLLIVICLGAYTSAQWLAGQKFVAGAFELSATWSLLLFSTLIIAYTSIGGFRGSVYADAVQAVIRIIGTLLALVLVSFYAINHHLEFINNWQAAGESFNQWLPGNSLSAFIFFILGYAFAAFGFGLGQPQLVSRYLAGRSPEETKSAQWIYIGFVQFTWLSMTLFGVLLRGVMPDISDPEAGLSIFFHSHFSGIISGIIIADIFSTIAATSNSLLVAMAQAVLHGVFPKSVSENSRLSITMVFILGAITMIGSVLLADKSTVFAIAIGAISLMASGLAAPVLIKIFNHPRSGTSLFISMVMGLVSASLWKYSEMSNILNEAAIGISIGFISNYLFMLRTKKIENKKLSMERQQ